VSLDKTLIYGSILGFEGQVAVFNHKKVKPEIYSIPRPEGCAQL
jgi:adenylyltransferase/sulfurtransferase